MTREDAKNLFRNDTDAYGKPKGIMGKIDRIFDEFEQRDLYVIRRVNSGASDASDLIGFTFDEQVAKSMVNVFTTYEKVPKVISK